MKETAFSFTTPRCVVRAFHVGDRINTAGYDGEVLSPAPLTVRESPDGVVVLFRYGVVVTMGLSPAEDAALLERLTPRIVGKFATVEDEFAVVELSADKEDKIPLGGPIQLARMSLDRFLLVADVLSKSVTLAHDERDVAKVFEVLEPFAHELASQGRTRRDRRSILRLIGNSLLVQNRVSGRVAVAEKPDVLWERPDLERLYARLEDEYELQERLDTLNRKVELVAKTANTLADFIDTRRSLRLEVIIVLLIAFEIVITLYQLFWQRSH
ncbi:putative Rmd1/YagE family protein [Nitrobacteraceae bacterium AZCC 1564]